MSYCPECGVDHHIADREAEKIADREVMLARIGADKEIKIAQINAGAVKELAETENALRTEHAEGITEGMETVLAAAGGGGQAEEPGDVPPVVVEAPAEEPAEEPGPDMEPPIVETPSPRSSSSDRGWFAGYRH